MTTIPWQSLNWFDAVILGIIVISALISILRGFIREAISVVTWLVAIILALKFALPLSSVLQNMIASQTVRYLIAFVVILCGVLIIGLIVNTLIRKLVKQSGISVLDRLLGFFFGFARGVLLVALILLLLQMSALQDSTAIKKSQLSPRFSTVVNWLHNFIPDKVQQLTKWTEKNVPEFGIKTATHEIMAPSAAETKDTTTQGQ